MKNPFHRLSHLNLVRRLSGRFGNLPLRRKYLYSHAAVVLFAVVVLSPTSYLIARNQMESKTGEFASVILEKSAIIWQTKVREIIDYFIVQFDAYNIGQNLKLLGDEDQSVRRLRIEKALADIITYKEGIKFILIDTQDSRRYYHQRPGEVILPTEIIRLIPYDHVKDLHARPLILTGPENTIMFSKVIYDLQTTEYLGILTIGFDYESFSVVFPDENETALGNLMIVDRSLSRPVIATPGAEVLLEYYRSASRNGGKSSASGRRTINGIRYVVEEVNTDDGRWIFQSYTAIADIVRLSTTAGLFIALASAIALALATRLSAFLAGRETERILYIKDHAQQIAAGDLTVESRDDHMDELGQLAGAIGDLSDRISSLVEGLASERARLDEARYSALQFEYSALQSKINPHFLYNSLEMVNAMAKLECQTEISEMVQLIGDLMRESIRRRNSLIPLSEEIEYIRKYLKIQEIMHENSLKISIEVQERLNGYYVPNFILQPIVENAIVHGIEPVSYPGEIRINAFRSGSGVNIEVCDNGVGIPEDTALQILDDETEDDPRHTKIGLSSVNRRIRIIYGDDYGISLEHRTAGGTRVLIKLPEKHEVKQ